MSNKQKIIISITGITIVILILLGLTYAYFVTQIKENPNSKSIEVTTANLKLIYGDENGFVSANGIMPGTSIKKTFTVKNTGNEKVYGYVVYMENVKNDFDNNEDLVYSITCGNKLSKTSCNGTTSGIFPKVNSILLTNNIDPGETQEYVFNLMYNESNKNQSNDMNKTASGKLNIYDIKKFNNYAPDSLSSTIITNAASLKNGTPLLGIPISDPARELNTMKMSTVEPQTFEIMSTPVVTNYYTYANEYSFDEKTGKFSLINPGIIQYESGIENLFGKYVVDYQGSPSDIIQSSSNLTSIYKFTTNVSDLTLSSLKAATVGKKYTSTENILSVTDDDFGKSYYFRGNVTNNYINFNKMCFRIVRIEGDGSIKIILEDANNICESSNGNWNIGIGNYGYTLDYVTNSSGNQSSNKILFANYLNPQTNSDKSMYNALKNWFQSKEMNTNLLKEDSWCLGDLTTLYDAYYDLTSTPKNDMLYSGSTFHYKTEKRLFGYKEKRNTTLMCNQTNDVKFNSYIGAINADEVVFAGAMASSSEEPYSNLAFYLVNDYQKSNAMHFWTLNSYNYWSVNGESAFKINEYGSLSSNTVNKERNFRPVLVLKNNVKIVSGDGTKTSPYIINE